MMIALTLCNYSGAAITALSCNWLLQKLESRVNREM